MKLSVCPDGNNSETENLARWERACPAIAVLQSPRIAGQARSHRGDKRHDDSIQVCMKNHLDMGFHSSPLGLGGESTIDSLTIDLPGAEPGSAYLRLSLMGDPWDSQLSDYLTKHRPPSEHRDARPWRNMTPHWLPSSTCSWIPAKDGQGLRLSGPFNTEWGVLGSKPRTVSLRLWYRNPLTALLGAGTFIGGERGVAFTLNDHAGVVALRNDPTPELDQMPKFELGAGLPGAHYLQPKDNT